MPPHLHPRSRLTSSLFATTLLASFIVVGIPHILPCPAPRLAYADSSEMSPDGTQRQRQRRRRRKCAAASETVKETPQQQQQLEEGATDEEDGLLEQGNEGRSRAQCPVPKPGGVVGEMLGFRGRKEGKGSGRPP